MLRKLSDGLTFVELSDPNNPRPHFSARRSSEELLAPMRAARERRIHHGEFARHERKLRMSQMNSWITTHTTAVPTVELSTARRASLRECFDILDADSGGTINLSELSLAMKALGFTAAACKEALESGDRDGDGALNFEEFVALLARVGGGGGGSEGMGGDSFPFALVANSYRISKLVESFNPARQLAKEAALQRKHDSIVAAATAAKRGSLQPQDASGAGVGALPPIAFAGTALLTRERTEQLQLTAVAKLAKRAKFGAAPPDAPKAEHPRKLTARSHTDRFLMLNDVAYGGSASASPPAAAAQAPQAPQAGSKVPKKAKGQRPALGRLPAIGDGRVCMTSQT